MNKLDKMTLEQIYNLESEYSPQVCFGGKYFSAELEEPKITMQRGGLIRARMAFHRKKDNRKRGKANPKVTLD